MNVIRGTFRLSVIVAAVVLGYCAWAAQQAYVEQRSRDFEIWFNMRCAKELLQRDTRDVENEFGNIDLQRVGCAKRQFWSNKGEIAAALKQEKPDYTLSDRAWSNGIVDAVATAVGTFLLVNVVGFLFLGARRAYRWVAAGYGTGS